MKPLYNGDNDHGDWPIRSKNICELSSLFGGGSTTTKTSPWGAQAPYLKDAFSQAQNLDQNNPLSYYTGQAVAPLNSTENTALSNISNLSQNDPTTAAAQGYTSDVLNGKYLNSNPYQDSTAQSVLSQVIPQITSQFVNTNSMGNPQAAYAAAQGATSALAPIEYQNYQNDQSNMLKADALAPQTQGLQYTDYTQGLGAGQTQQQQQQAQDTNSMNAYNFNQQAPYQQLQNYLGAVSGNYGSQSTSQASSNPLTSIFGMLSQPSSQLSSTFGNIGSNLGSAASGIGSLLAFL